MSEKLSIVHEWRTITLTKPLNALVQSVLEEACVVLKISDPSSVKLVVEKGEKHIDHSLTLRMANIKAATKLALVNSQVAVTLSWKDESHTQLFPVSATLHDVLEGFDAKVPVPAAATAAPDSSSSTSSVPAPSSSARGSPRWSGWTGIPAPEVNAQFEVHIHVPGWMAPVLEVGVRKVTGDELRSLRLSNLGVQSDSAQPSKLKMRLSHSYTPPVRTEAEQKEVMENFQRKYNAMMGIGVGGAGSSGAAAASSAPAPAPRSAGAGAGAGVCPARPTQHVKFADEEEGEDIEVGSDSESEDAAVAPVEIPADRRIALLHALPGMLPAPELPEEFYEVTDEDSLAYARALRLEADRARASFGLPPTDLPLNGSGGASAASLHRASVVAQAALSHMSPSDAPAPSPGGLMDSARLPAVPQKKRSARRRRACHATMIRVRLPDHLYVEGLFKADETPADLYRWMDSLLLPVAPVAAPAAQAGGDAAAAPAPTTTTAPSSASKHPDYYLYITPPRQQLGRHSRLTFAQLGLLPAALVHYGTSAQAQVQQGVGSFSVERDTPEQIAAAREANPARGLLRDEWVDKVKKILPPPVVRRAPAPVAPSDEKSDADQKETTTTPADKDETPAATAAMSPQLSSPNAMD